MPSIRLEKGRRFSVFLLYYGYMVAERPLVAEDAELQTMYALAARCASRRLIYRLVMSDVHRWTGMGRDERRTALERARRRVQAVCPNSSF